ncbi:hypothetical protein Vadar_005154 [Vaccinium darrowii]|uniref:Uncharacterized protein n=1 Tax=Vaccinium darrowii TaxID=229202 RepID=A0ACB7XWU8_9ERIC|nr:hypothetical protein Vadar_005154 [Vaccinium darrowii]
MPPSVWLFPPPGLGPESLMAPRDNPTILPSIGRAWLGEKIELISRRIKKQKLRHCMSPLDMLWENEGRRRGEIGDREGAGPSLEEAATGVVGGAGRATSAVDVGSEGVRFVMIQCKVLDACCYLVGEPKIGHAAATGSRIRLCLAT